MTIRFAGGLVLPSVPRRALCTILVQEVATFTVEVDVMTCCLRVIKPCLAQGAAVTFQFKDVNAATDFTGASEITFDIWQGGIAGTPLLSKTLSGGDITLPDNRIFQLIVTNAESQALPRGRHHCEAWVTLSGGERRLVGAGPFLVKDTRKHDP